MSKRIEAIKRDLADGVICYSRDYDDYDTDEAQAEIGYLISRLEEAERLLLELPGKDNPYVAAFLAGKGDGK